MKNPDHISESVHTIVFWLKFFDADPGSGMEKFRIRDGKYPDPQYCLSGGLSLVRDFIQNRLIQTKTLKTRGPPELVQHFRL